MTQRDVQKHYRAVPFVPFRLTTIDGESFDVLGHQPLAFGVKGRRIAVGLADDTIVVLDLRCVAVIEKPIPRRRSERRGAA